VGKVFEKVFKEVFKQVATKYSSEYIDQCLSLLGLETPCKWLLRWLMRALSGNFGEYERGPSRTSMGIDTRRRYN
jgi:hypothetical protein